MHLFKAPLLPLKNLEDLHYKEPCFSAADKVERKGRDYHIYFQESKADIISLNLHEEGQYCIHIHCAENTQNTLLLHNIVNTKQSTKIYFHLENKATLYCVSHTQNEESSLHSLKVFAELAAHAKLYTTGLHIAEGESNVDFHVQMRGEESESSMQYIVLGKGKSKTDLKVQNESIASHTHGNIRMRSILNDRSFVRMQGAPTVNLEAQACTAHLEQKNLLLSKTARTISLPLLSVSHDEVEASHSASVSTFLPEDLFYLQSRGLNKEESTKLIVEAFITELFEYIPSENLQACLKDNIKEFTA